MDILNYSNDSNDEEIAQINPNSITKFTFKECFNQIKNVLSIVEGRNSDPEDCAIVAQHNNVVSQILKRYFENETPKDLYGGFLNLFVQSYNWALSTRNSLKEAVRLVTQVLREFYEYVLKIEEEERKLLLSPETSIYVSYLLLL